LIVSGNGKNYLYIKSDPATGYSSNSTN